MTPPDSAILKFCPHCASPLIRHEVGGELRRHWICPRCSKIHIDHPMIVTNCFVACGKRLLWVQRAIAPRRGLWAIPGGFLENGERLEDGAVREVREEAGVMLEQDRLRFYMVGTLVSFSQVYFAYVTRVGSEHCSPGPESMACGFFARDEVPWDEVAYPEVNEHILQAYDDLESGRFGLWETELGQRGLRRVRIG
ncbi:NUDIX domain-containing protein [Haliea sp. E17]|uniref:NUDIX domain-containing protein n=1 Tax=Haliea sp. E17 TaxID=3401576 RepID=UPI003AAFAF96